MPAEVEHFEGSSADRDVELAFVEQVGEVGEFLVAGPSARVEDAVRDGAIGEAGLDYHYDKSPRPMQSAGFRTHIEAARQTGLPLVIHARAAEARKRDDMPWFSQVGPALARVPRVIAATVDAFREEGPATRLPILVAAGVVLAVATLGLAMAANTVWRVVKMPATIRSRKASGTGVAVSASVFEIVMGVVGVLICLSLVMLVLLGQLAKVAL